MLDPSISSEQRQQAIDQIRAEADRLPTGTIAGEPVMVVDGFKYVEQDGARLAKWTLALLAVTLFVLFRSIRWVFIPIAVVGWSILLTQSVLYVTDLKLSMVSSMLTAIVTVVAVATVVHIIVRFRVARREGLSPTAALQQSFVLLAAPIAWSCLTDAVGFASLALAKVGPVHDFGIMMAIGSCMVLLGVFALVPALALMGRHGAPPAAPWGDATLDWSLTATIRTVGSHPIWLVLGLVAVIGVSLGGISRLQVETDFTRNFRRDSSLVQSYEFIEERLGGAGVWDVLLPTPPRLTRDYIEEVHNLQTDLRALTITNEQGEQEPALTKVISMADAIIASEASSLSRMVPKAVAVEATLLGMSKAMPDFTAAMLYRSEDEAALRIMLRAKERQPAAEKLKLIQAVEDRVSQFVDQHHQQLGEQPQGAVTGFYVLLANLIQSVLRDQWICLIAATIGIGGMMTVAFRSLKLAVVAIVPNLLPILIALGSMGWLRIDMNMGAAMIAAVSMGLSVDSSIHYVVAYRRERQRGCSKHDALHNVQHTVGRAVVFSTVALIVGFVTLCVSNFVPTIYFGALVSLSMLGGLFGNLLALPLLINLVERDAESTVSLSNNQA